MSKFQSPNEKENSTLAQAQSLLALRRQLTLPALGIYVCPTGSAEYIGEIDFEPNGIKATEFYNYLIRTKQGKDADENNAVAGHGHHVNVAAEWATWNGAVDFEDALFRALAMERPGISKAEVTAVINNIPGMESATKAANKARQAVIKTFLAQGAEAPPPFPPGP